MITPKVGFVVYGAHKGMVDNNNLPYIDTGLIDKACDALKKNDVNLVVCNKIISDKREARDTLNVFKNNKSLDCIILFTGSWVWAANLVSAIRDFSFSSKGIIIWTCPGAQGWRSGARGIAQRCTV